MKRIRSNIPRGPYGKANANNERRNSMDILKEVRGQYPPYKKWELLSQLALSHYVATGDRQSFARHRRAKRKSEDMSLDMARNQARMFSARVEG